MSAQPVTFSIVVPVYNVQDYLAECLESILGQDGVDVEVIAIDDASTDGSARLLDEYASADARLVVVHLERNGGLGPARNTGVELARGRYLLFVDSDDSLAPGALAAIAERIASTDEPDLVVFDFVRTHPSGQPTPDPLSAELVALGSAPLRADTQPRYLQLFPVAWNKAYRREFITAGGFRFPTGFYEDLPFTYPVLITASRIVTLNRVCYLYRQRAGQILRSADRRHVDFFTQFDLVFAYLDAHPELDAWRVSLYDRLTRHATWIMERRDRVAPELRREFFQAAAGSFRRHRPPGFTAPSRTAAAKIALVERGDYRAFRAAQLANAGLRRTSTLRSARPAGTRTADAQVRIDRLRGLRRISFPVAAVPPEEHVILDGVDVQPLHAKTRASNAVQHERIIWLPMDATLTVDGRDVTRQASPPAAASSPAARLRRIRSVIRENPRLWRTIVGDVLARLAARRPAARTRFRDAWLLIDRDSDAQDNAEHLYRHLREHRPDVNAWFVLRPDSPDWNRLQAEGFRLLRFGTREHYVALLHCVHLVSSQVDTYVNQPFWQHLLGTPPWRFTFVQHGVTQNDLSHWINDKPIDLVLTATPDEQDGFVADGTPYPYTSLDARLTGFTRHDRLLALGAAVTDPRTLLVMPTWRQDLLGAKARGNRRELRPDFWTSHFALAWRAVLESDRMRDLCAAAGWTLHFVLHPNLQDYVDEHPLPAGVRTSRFRDLDVQQVLAEAAVLVTDYSSLAFEAAYLQRPVVYYQFDRDAFFAGGHIVRRGSWSYETQGFGPVTTTADGTLAALEAIVAGTVDPVYAVRSRTSFPFRDGQCCARTVTAIETLRRPVPADQVVRPVSRHRSR